MILNVSDVYSHDQKMKPHLTEKAKEMNTPSAVRLPYVSTFCKHYLLYALQIGTLVWGGEVEA